MKNNTLVWRELMLMRDGMALTPPFDMALEAGELLAIHGRNGAGKSTLLKTIAGLHTQFHGSIVWNNAPLADSSQRPLYLGHRRGIHPSLSVCDNVKSWADAAGVPELYEAALHYFDLEELEDVPVGHLSAGWQQRVALTRLITIPSALWLLDEPTSNLDNDGIELLHSLMQTRMEQGGIVLVASHHDVQGNKVKKLNISELNEMPKVIH